jgi:hypothetical protein
MKIIAFFMAFYILLLPAIPCSDVHNDCNNITLQIQNDDKHKQSEEQNENCSPFCYCVCCSTTISSIDNYTYQLKTPKFFVSKQKVFSINSNVDCGFYGVVWQPPRA